MLSSKNLPKKKLGLIFFLLIYYIYIAREPQPILKGAITMFKCEFQFQ
jgi:hypothetical protein